MKFYISKSGISLTKQIKNKAFIQKNISLKINAAIFRVQKMVLKCQSVILKMQGKYAQPWTNPCVLLCLYLIL